MAVHSESLPADVEADSVKDARALIYQRRWGVAFRVLNQLDSRSALGAQDLEALAVSAFLCGRERESRHAWLRAYQIHLSGGDHRSAALCAMRIGFGQISPGEIAQAAGCLPASLTSCATWTAQASSLLADGHEGVEHGYLLIPVAYEQLAIEGDLEAAATDSARAVEMARRFDDRDLLVLGLTIQGRAIVRSESIERGMALIDEAVMVVETGDVSPSIAGIVFSAAIETASEAFDINRFGEWTAGFGRWCELQEGMVAFQSRSLAYRATFDHLHGRWEEALDAAALACEAPIAESDAAAAASAHYRRGEILRLRGQVQEAEQAYREATRLGLDPQPGLAQLRGANGEFEAAVSSIGRALGEAGNPLHRAAMLPGYVETLLESGDPTAASEAADELEKTAEAWRTPALEAAAHQARGCVRLAEGDPQGALDRLRVAGRVWAHLGLTYDEARTRVVIAECCRMLEDDDAATLELDIAHNVFSALGARPDVERVDSLLATSSSSPPHGLTRRELEVLRLLARGMTNREISAELVVAMRTVDSHVSNILTKLGVSTRSAATAFAHRQNLL